ncbi:MAG: hypothetical protein KJP00_04735 [Bacteroidia bacterium]|nr:hypothetical protein [Bacteroidia bacterium]
MKNLIEISKIVTKKKVRKIEIFDDHSLRNRNSKFNEFYESLLANKFKNDRDAASALYECSPTDDKYRQLKSRFRKRLLNTLFFLDINLPSTSSYDRAYYSCNKDWTLVKILESNHAKLTSTALAKQILTTSLKFKFADIIVDCARLLRKNSAYEGNEKGFSLYHGYIQQYTKILEADLEAEELFQRVVMIYKNALSLPEDQRSQIDDYSNQLVTLSENFDSPVIFFNMYLVWAYRYELLKDYHAMLEVCNQAEKYIEENPSYYRQDKLATFQLKKMSAYLHMKDYKNGKINAEKSLKSFTTGTDTWFEFMEYYFLLSIQTNNYINAMAIFNEASSHSKYKRLKTFNREKWKIYEVYLNYFLETEPSLNLAALAQKKKPFRASRFLNDPLLYPKDQRIFTVLMVIAQVLFFLDKKNYHSVTERIDRLKSYATRQLKKEEYFRAAQFIKLLQQLSKAGFQKENLSNTEKYYNRLMERPFSYKGKINELEIIPYNELWDHIVEKL